MVKMRRVTLFDVSIIALFLTLFFFIIMYPSVSDFDYWHMEVSKVVEQKGYIALEDTNSGFYIFTVILHLLTFISYDILPSLPIQLIPLIVLLTAILKNVKNGFICTLIVLYYITTLSNPSLLTWGSHDVAFLLFLTALLITIMYEQKTSVQSIISNRFILILLVIVVNFISYKMDLNLISFLFIFSMMGIYSYRENEKLQKTPFLKIILIGIIVTLSFNMVFYNTFLPHLRVTSETSFAFSSGLSKIYSILHHDQSNPLSEFLFQPQKGIIYARIFQNIILLTSFLFSSILIIKKIKIKQSLSSHEHIFIGLVGSGFILFLIYNSYGFAELSILFFSGIIGFIVISDSDSKKYDKFVIISILLLIATNGYVISEKINNNYISGQSDYNNFQYLKPSSEWYTEYSINVTDINTVTDVFTRGYFMKELANKDRSNYPGELTSKDIIFLYHLENCTFPTENNKRRFIINYKESYSTMEDWKFFKPFSIYQENIELNPNLNSIYTSGDIVIYDGKCT